MNYYLDIETTGLDPLQSKIITIQYMELERNTGKPVGPLKILKEWESDEKTILKRFIDDFVPGNQWAFIPIGFNLQFEHSFFWQRCISNGLQPVDIFNGPFLDLKTVAVLMNKGEFKGASLHKMTNKPHGGGNIPQICKIFDLMLGCLVTRKHCLHLIGFPPVYPLRHSLLKRLH